MPILTREMKILKYIYRKNAVTGKQLTKKFSDIDDYYNRLKEEYIRENVAKYELKNSYIVKHKIDPEEPIIFLTIQGKDAVVKSKHEFWYFVLPYAITTFIALISAAPTIYKIVMFICGLFQKSTP